MTAERNRIDHPHPLHTELQILAYLLQSFCSCIIRREYLDAQVRRPCDVTPPEFPFWSLGNHTHIGYAKMIRARLNPLFRQGDQTETTPDSPQLPIKKTCTMECS